MQIWPHSRMDWKKEIKRRGCIVLTHPLFFLPLFIKVSVMQHNPLSHTLLPTDTRCRSGIGRQFKKKTVE